MFTEPMIVFERKKEPLPYPKERVKWKGTKFFIAKAVSVYQNDELVYLDMYRVYFLCNGMGVGINFGTIKSAKILANELERIEYDGDYSQKSLYDTYFPFVKAWKDKRLILLNIPYKGE